MKLFYQLKLDAILLPVIALLICLGGWALIAGHGTTTVSVDDWGDKVTKTERPLASITFSPLNSTIPSGSQARGDTGRRIWMMGSKARVKFFDKPRKKPMGVPRRRAIT